MSDANLPCVCTTLRKAARAVSRMYDEQLEGTGVTITQFAILRAAQRAPGAALSRLAETMVMDRTSLYRALEPMARQGWLTLEAGDGRAKVACLTPAGLAVIAAAAPCWEASQARLLDVFGRADWADLSQTLKRVLDATAEAQV